MVCHCSCRAMDSSKLFEKNWTSSGSNTLCTRLCATRPPSPVSQVLILAEAGRGSLLSVKVGCQLGTVSEDEATSMPPQAAGRGPLIGSCIVIPFDGRGEGGSFCGHVTGDPKCLVLHTLLLFRMARWGRRRRSTVLALRLLGLS